MARSRAAAAVRRGRSSAGLRLRLIGFEAAQGPARRRRLGDAVAAAHALELALADHLHRHADLAVVRPLRGAGDERGRGRGHKGDRRKGSDVNITLDKRRAQSTQCATVKFNVMYINSKTVKLNT